MKLQVNLKEINLILQALGKRPFEEVYELIGKINQQVNEQIANQRKPIQ